MVEPATRRFRRHAAAFFSVNLLLTVVNLVGGRPWWAFWVLLPWGLVFTIHYLVWKTTHIDEQWVEERADELRQKSYDRGHIDSIETRYGGPPPAPGRKPPPR